MPTQFKSKEEIFDSMYNGFMGTRYTCENWPELKDLPGDLKECIYASIDEYHTQFSPPIEGEELYHWVKASERMPTETSGFAEDIIYKIQLDSGQRLRISTINQFLETVKYRITEKFEWLEKITPNKTLIEGKEEDESRTYTEQDILFVYEETANHFRGKILYSDLFTAEKERFFKNLMTTLNQ